MSPSRTVLAFVLLLSGALGSFAPAQSDPASVEELKAAIPELMNKADVRGVSVALIRDSEIVWTEAFGVKDALTQEPVETSTEFQAASNGKMIAAYAAFLLIEEGRLSLDDPLVDDRLVLGEDCPVPTLGEALSHTAGLGNDIFADEFKAVCLDEEERAFAYAGQGFHVLQSMLGSRTGVQADVWINERILSPLGMASSRFAPERSDKMATGHVDLVFGLLSSRANETDLEKAYWVLGVIGFGILLGAVFLFRAFGFVRGLFVSVLLVFLVGATTLFALSRVTVPISSEPKRVMLASSLESTAEDLARFAVELIEPTLMSHATRDQMLTPLAQINDRTSWAAGIGIDTTNERVTYWHWGSNPGYQSLFVVDPATGDGIVVLTNTGGFLDFVSRNRGGYNMAKRVARLALDHDGAWDIRDNR